MEIADDCRVRLIECVVVDRVEDVAFVGVREDRLLAEMFPLELHGTGGGGGVRKLAFDVGDEYGGACGEVGRLEVEIGRLQGSGQVLGKGVWKGGGLGLVFCFGVVIVGR